ncbi:C2H2-type domain-containing protein [Aphis craccivora]|uniref:C2H2-type domain-containing protein n=1 Tax=Aphis craccivora TaxID=307492 RepID=A0A6G0W2Z9_APHCR|nr:C2H2-type domain-containing protein [Aphis craccivora]
MQRLIILSPRIMTKRKRIPGWCIEIVSNNLLKMSKYMPYGSFNWVDPNLDGLSELTHHTFRFPIL